MDCLVRPVDNVDWFIVIVDLHSLIIYQINRHAKPDFVVKVPDSTTDDAYAADAGDENVPVGSIPGPRTI